MFVFEDMELIFSQYSGCSERVTRNYTKYRRQHKELVTTCLHCQAYFCPVCEIGTIAKFAKHASVMNLVGIESFHECLHDTYW